MYCIYTNPHAKQEQSNDQEINRAHKAGRDRPADPFVESPGMAEIIVLCWKCFRSDEVNSYLSTSEGGSETKQSVLRVALFLKHRHGRSLPITKSGRIIIHKEL